MTRAYMRDTHVQASANKEVALAEEAKILKTRSKSGRKTLFLVLVESRRRIVVPELLKQQQLNTHMQSAVHFRRPEHLSIQWKSEAPRPPATGSPGPTVDRERCSGEGNDILASVLMRIGVNCSEDGRGAGTDSPEHHHHPQELGNPTA